MDYDVITEGVKKAFDTFVQNIVAYIVGVLIAIIGSIFIITIAPLFYGLYYMAIKGARGEQVEIKDVFYGFSSIGVIIRSWIGFLVVGLISAIIGFIVGFIIGFILGLVIVAVPSLALMVSLLSMIVSLIVSIIIQIFLFYTMYIYIMTPSENILYALKESVDIGKSNILMVFLTILISGILSIFIITMPLGSLFAVYVLKELKPELKDGSGL